MSTKDLIDAIVHQPHEKPLASIIFLHGLGVDGHDLEGLLPMLKLYDIPIRAIFPHAPIRPVTLNQGHRMSAWFDIEDISMDAREDEQGIRESSQMIQNWIEHESEKVGSEHVFLVGFSQGGALALHTCLRYPKPLAGCAVLSGFLALREKISKEAHSANQSIPIWMGHGELDPLVPLEFGSYTHQYLEQAGYKNEFYVFPVAHHVCEEETFMLGDWLKNILIKSSKQKSSDPEQ